MSSAEEIPPVNPGFEGPEKVLEIDFTPGLGPENGLRAITRPEWDSVCTAARCTILNSLSNDKLDSYVLSESSLFVYPLKLILKTCGTTTLLKALEPLLPITEKLGMKVEWVAYTRKNFIFPEVQKFPHRDPQEETSYLKKYFPEGSAFLLGPMTGDHWLVYVADYVDRPTTECVDRTLDMMMFGIDQEVAKLFVKDTARFPLDSDVTKASGIDGLLPGSSIQEFCFEPCGYSMNGLLYDAYWTIHITPESHCSYASFETNIRMKDYNSLVKAVLAIFRPTRYTMTLFADEYGINAMSRLPFDQLQSVPLVETEQRSIIGPCVLLADGNTAYPPTPKNVAGAAAAAGGPSTPTGSMTPSASAVDLSTVVTDPVAESSGAPPASMLASALTAGASASSTSTTDPSTVASAAGSVASSGAASTASGNASPTQDEHAAAAAAAVAPATPVAAPAPVSLKRVGSTVRLRENRTVGRKGALSYVQSHKSSSEFMGYSCFMSNYSLVHSVNTNMSHSAVVASDVVPQAATDALSMPRAKYVVSQRLNEIRQKQTRTESF